jgi:hypothetical protein
MDALDLGCIEGPTPQGGPTPQEGPTPQGGPTPQRWPIPQGAQLLKEPNFIPFIAVSITVVICFYFISILLVKKTLYVLIFDQFTNVNNMYLILYRKKNKKRFTCISVATGLISFGIPLIQTL